MSKARRSPIRNRTTAPKGPRQRSTVDELRRLILAQAAQIELLQAKVQDMSGTAGDYVALQRRLADIETRVNGVGRDRATELGGDRSSGAGGLVDAATGKKQRLGRLAWDDYRSLVSSVRAAVMRATPPRAAVLVVSRGDVQLLGIRGRTASHFPQGPDGKYAGYHPRDSDAAIANLESLVARGSQFLVFPSTAFWWLDHYAEFRDYLARNHRCAATDDNCIIYQLSGRGRANRKAVQSAGRSSRKSRNDSPTNDEGFNPYPVFDPDWYLKQNPDVRKAGFEPLEHYLSRGAKAGLSPHPLFDSRFYRKTYPESLQGYDDPLQHYLAEGWKKGYKPSPDFDPSYYLANYPDVAAAGMEPLTHYILAGQGEGRFGSAPTDARLEPFAATYQIPAKLTFKKPPPAVRAKAIAFFLPQFHPIPENDRWWGKGFTEWTNVRRATPQFEGHYQPHVPKGLGYYDLRDPETLDAQAALARNHGIHGFCYYYYWFHGKVLLDLPVRRILKTGRPDFPFCICWANENWTRRWDGLEKEVLISQNHSAKDDLAFIRRVEPILLHKNYIRVDGKPLLLVYRPSLFPNPAETAARWRADFRSRGHGELYLAATRTFNHSAAPSEFGFDAAIQFPPHVSTMPVTYLIPGRSPTFEGRVFDYTRAKEKFLEELRRAPDTHRLYPGVMPSWDNTPRRQHRSHVWVNTSPESYYDWLSKAVEHGQKRTETRNDLVFINGWNEWAEGCHLEPDAKYGHAWLNATRLALQPNPPFRTEATARRLSLKPSADPPPPLVAKGRPPRPVPTRPVTVPGSGNAPDYYRLRRLPVGPAGRGSSARANSRGSVAVHIHAYFLDVLPKLLRRLEAIPRRYDLFVSTDTGVKCREIRKLLGRSAARRSSLQIEVCPNRGRDVGPMVSAFAGQLLAYPTALHIHTKKCEYDEAHGTAWLDHNLDHLLHSPRYVAAALDMFDRDNTQGVLLPVPYPGIASWMHWGENRAVALRLLERLEIPEDCLKAMPLYFPASMMFWFRPSALQQLLSAGISYDDFPPEPIHYDGTLAHAIERCILYVAAYNGYSYATIAPEWESSRRRLAGIGSVRTARARA